MSIKHLKTLMMIAEYEGFSAAAERLFITQSAVSLQMKALEQEWRVTLFDRTTRPPVLNRQGWLLVHRAGALIEQYDALKASVDAPASELVGSLRVGIVPSAATNLLPAVLLRLRQAHRGLTTRAESGLSAELLFKVGQGRLDAAVVTGPDRLEPGLSAELIRQEELKLFCHDDLVLPDVDEMLATRPFIRFSGAMGVGQIVDDALRSRRFKVNAILELDSIEAILGMVHLGLGIAILPEHSTSGRRSRHRSELSLTPPVTRNLVLAARREYIELPTIKAFLATFRAVAATAPSGGPG